MTDPTDEHDPGGKLPWASLAAPRFTRRTALKAGAAGMLCGGDLLAALRAAQGAEASHFGADAPPISLVFDEPHDRPAGRVTWPVTVGIPFANGALPSTDGLALFAGDAAAATFASAAVPAAAQFTEAIRWRAGAKTISWVHCDTQSEFGAGLQPAAMLRGGGRNTAPRRAVTVADKGTHFQVDTGAVSFTCSKTAFNLFDSFAAGDTRLISGSSLYWKDTAGTVYEGKHVVSNVEVEKSGPMRAVIRYDGWYQSGAGSRKLRYTVWLHAFAGLPYVRIYDKLIWTENLALFVSIDPATGTLTTKSLPGVRGDTNAAIVHGWSTGDRVRWSYSHSERDARGNSQFFDSTSKRGNAAVVLPKVEGAPIDRTVDYFIHVTGETTFTLHRTEVDARAGARPMEFLDIGNLIENGTTLVGRHYLEAQQPVLAEWGLKFQFAEPARQTFVDVVGSERPAGYDLPAAETVTAYQHKYGSATLSAGGSAAREVTIDHLAGWAEARFASGAGLAVSVKALANQTPKQFVIDGSSLTVKLWGGSPMSLSEPDRAPPGYHEFGYQKEWLAFSGEPNPVGISKTHEIWVWPARPLADNRLINDLVQRPAACCPDPSYSCSTGYLISTRASSETPARYQYIETALENMMRNLTSREPAGGDYEEWNFGDLRLFRNGPFRTWDNGGYDCCDVFWRQWYRTGKRFFLEEGIYNARHVMDVDTIAHSQQVIGNGDSYVRIAGRTHLYATLHWAWPEPYGDLFADHPAYLLLCWLMTGYEPARVVLETKVEERKRVNYGDPGNLNNYSLPFITREQYGAAPPKFIYHELTGDAKFYEAGRNWLELAIKAQAANRETNGLGGHYFPNNNFWGFFYEAFLLAHRYSGEPALLQAIAEIVSEYAVVPKRQFDAPYFVYSAVGGNRQARFDAGLVPFVAAYRLSGNTAYLQYPVDRIMRQCRTVQTSEPWVGYDVIDGIRAPLFLRDAIRVLGAWGDAGHPPIDWKGNLPLIGSVPIAGDPWNSQLTLWVKTSAPGTGSVRLLFKDSNLTGFELPGRVRAVIIDPTGHVTARMLTTDTRYPVKVARTQLTPAAGASLSTGLAVRVISSGKLPPAITADTTYYLQATAGPPPAWTIHRSAADSFAGKNPLDLSGGAGAVAIAAVKSLDEAHIPLPSDGPAGIYRIHVQGECAFFRASPASDTEGLVAELHGLSDLTLDATFGPAEYYFRMRRGQSTLTLSTSKFESSHAAPVAVLDLANNKFGSLDYEGEKPNAAEIKIPQAQIGQVLKLAKGVEEFSPNSLSSLPMVRLAGAERYVSVTAEQWFNPLAAFDREIAAFWSLDEPSGTRRDATGNRRDLDELRGPVGVDRDNRLGSAADFAAPGNSWLRRIDPVFQASGGFTVWGWARLTELSSTRYLFVKGGDVYSAPTSCEWAVYVSPTPSPRLYLQARVGKKFVFTRGVPFSADSEMHFVIAWYDPAAKTMFVEVDSGEIVSQTLPGPINIGNEPFNVGGAGPNQRGWIGQIAAVGFASTALTAAERRLLYNGGSGRHYPF